MRRWWWTPRVRMNQVTVGSCDLARAEDFYTALGLRLIVRSDHYLRFECPDGEATFSVELVADPPATSAESVTVYFECDDLDAEHARLTAAGIAFEHGPQDMPWLWREARLRDPDGHAVCLFRAGPYRTHPPWRLEA